MESEGAAVVICNTCAMFLILPKRVENYTCSKCKLVALLEEKVQQLEARISNHQQIKELELFLDRAEQTILDNEETGHSSQEEVISLTQEVDPWRNVTRRNRRARDRSESLNLQNQLEAPSPITPDEECTDEQLVPPEDLSFITLDEIQEEEQQEQTEDLSLNKVDEVNEDEQTAGERLLVLGDSIIRNTERWICDAHDNRVVSCLPGAKVADITRNLDSLLERTGKEPVVVVHVGTNDVGKAKQSVLEAKFRLLGRRLKSRTSKVAFSEVLPVPRAGPTRQAELRSLNAWMRRWCREEGFRFVRNWRTFWDKPNLFRGDGLHLNHDGTRLLALNIKKAAEQLLN